MAENGQIQSFEALVEYIKLSRGFDFTGYKRPSLRRRIEKRMQAVQMESFEEYQLYLDKHEDEFSDLFNTILINVTTFFRDAPLWDYLREDLLLAGAELIWQAGAHGDEKGHGLCHGTSGNGFALLKAFARTGDERWIERARCFAVHALAQAERIAAANGRRRYSLFNGDVGTAVFAAACLDADPRYPIVDLM